MPPNSQIKDIKTKNVKILHLEDSEADSILVKSAISKEFPLFEYYYADNKKDFLKILDEVIIDIVISDFELPGYSGSEALSVIKEKYPEIPFIFVSGVMGEDAAIASLVNGALDYVIKSKLQRLVPAITRALREARLLSEQILADSERRKLSQAVEQSSVSVIITDITGNIEYVNPKVSEISGYGKDELLGKNPRIFKSGTSPDTFYASLWREILAGNQWKGEILNKKKNGEYFWELMSISPIFGPDGSITHFVSIKEDITRQKTLIEELLAAKEKAEASDKLKMAFIQNISHEIRTPLNGILGISDFILQPDITEDDRKAYLAILNTSSERLISTVTNYLDISLLESGSTIVKPDQVDISTLVFKVYENYQHRCLTKGLNLMCKIPEDPDRRLVYCDKTLLIKALSHIVDNAVKFTASGDIIIGLRIAGKVFEIFITDTGMGIDEEDLKKVFHVFFQEKHSRNRDFEGSGLGLSISRGLIEKMGGSIKIDSVIGEGTTVIVSFPILSDSSARSGNSGVRKKAENEKPYTTVLVADDNWADLTFYKIIIESASLKFISVANGTEAVEMCMINPDISIVMMDADLAGMDVWEATKKIREFRPNIPVIFISNISFYEGKTNSVDSVFNGYLTKPVRGAQLLSIINQFIPGNSF